ncbi:MAG: transglutaminase family protein [Propionibacteriaceae bacterium]|jgi:transglutaminase-like putative cysteine protease|nr:transglutaminase family protein [Propionibacteriaceae bacterium]
MMRLKLRHESGFHYKGVIHTSYNEARLLPGDHAGQTVLSSRLSIRPRAGQYGYIDYFNTPVTHFEILTSHTELWVEATALVENDRGEPRQAEIAPWSELPELAGSTAKLVEYGQQTRRTRPPAEVADLAAAARREEPDPAAAAVRICREIRDHVEYVKGVTGVNSTAEEAWGQHRGVCQDITHIALGALRAAGIPARYVSGYLHPDAEPAVGVTAAGEMHAWIEFFTGHWLGFDPTNRSYIGDRHILVARGRDYDDIAPIRGVVNGEGESEMFVKVELTRVA